jgi:hypothetical protein
MRSSAGLLLLLLFSFFACNDDVETGPVAGTEDAGTPTPKDGSTETLDATIVDGGGPVPIVDASDRPCDGDDDCRGGTCFAGVCMCEVPKYVQADGRCGDDAPEECIAGGGRCQQDPAECMPGELEGELQTNQTCGDFVAAVCCFPAGSCKTTVDFVCCGASTTPYEPRCVNGWRTCLGLMPKLRSDTCP